MNYRLTIYDKDSKEAERIIDIQEFANRVDLMEFIDRIKVKPMPYKLDKKGDKGYQITGL